MFNSLKNYDAARHSTEECVALLVMADLLVQKFQDLGVEAPDWLAIKQREILRDVRARHADQVERKLKWAKANLESLRTPAEKRRMVEAEIAKLEKHLQES